MKQNERNFWLDVSLFVTFLCTVSTGMFLWLLIPHQATAFFGGVTRQFWLTVHTCSGIVCLAGVVIHVIWHREWLKAMRRRSTATLPPKVRANRVTDRYVWVCFLIVVVFGIIDWLIPAFENRASIFDRLHLAFGIAWLTGIVVHLVLHRRWIIFSSRHHLQLNK